MPRYALAFLLLLSTAVSACPFCNTENAREVRRGIVSGDVTTNALATLLPFLVTFAVVGFVHFGGRRKPGWSDD